MTRTTNHADAIRARHNPPIRFSLSLISWHNTRAPRVTKMSISGRFLDKFTIVSYPLMYQSGRDLIMETEEKGKRKKESLLFSNDQVKSDKKIY